MPTWQHEPKRMHSAATCYHSALALASPTELLSLPNAVLPALYHSLAADCSARAQRICECARFLFATNMLNAKRRRARMNATHMLPIREVARRPSCKANACRRSSPSSSTATKFFQLTFVRMHFAVKPVSFFYKICTRF